MNSNRTGNGNSSPSKEHQMFLYLDGGMTDQERHDFEIQMEADPFLNDAVEGLSHLQKAEISRTLVHLNQNLKKQIKNQRKNRKRLFANQKFMGWVALLIILLFVFIAWLYLKFLM